MTSKSYEVAVIGGGPGGYVAGIRLGHLGKKAVVIEREHLGGVCLNWGCIPSKSLIHAANVVSEIEESEKIGITTTDVKVDQKKVQSWKDGIITRQRGGIKTLLKANKCDHISGDASLTSKNTLSVKNSDGTTDEIRFEQLIIATGASVIQIPGFEFDDELVGYAKHAVSYDKVPENLVIVGGGVIGSELGVVYAKLGAKVTIVEMLGSILPGTDPDLIRPVAKKMKKLGIEVLTGAKAQGVDRKPGGAQVMVEVGGAIRAIPADKVLVAVGFRSNAKSLGIETAGVATDERGWITVNDRCQTNVPNIFAVGDVTGAPLLAHRASKMGEVAAEVIAGKPAAYDVRAMPLGVFTDPEVAQVGLTEAEAREQGLDINVGLFPIAALGRAAAMNQTDGVIKVVVDKANDVILGVGMSCFGACDFIAQACLALEMGALSEDIGLTVHAHPTLSEGIMEASNAARGEAVHIVNRPYRPRK
ncbi:MAG: dihydrolipoyl dehydrogenase [Myxococcota bacterium]|nr:dihydrolipoyl dehydrogenase [Myxococcota bacterium]